MAARDTRNGALTELEGAVLAVVHRVGPCTPYRVRQDFLTARSKEWSGSAGAVYPALRRLEEAGLLAAAEVGDARNSVRYALTKSGRSALADWLCDADTAAGSGLDPFRCRADLWDTLTPARRAALLREMTERLEAKCAELEALSASGHNDEPAGAELELALHRTRLRWLKIRPGRAKRGPASR